MSTTRRTYLKRAAVGTLAIAGLAGCAEPEEDYEGEEDGFEGEEEEEEEGFDSMKEPQEATGPENDEIWTKGSEENPWSKEDI